MCVCFQERWGGEVTGMFVSGEVGCSDWCVYVFSGEVVWRVTGVCVFRRGGVESDRCVCFQEMGWRVTGVFSGEVGWRVTGVCMCVFRRGGVESDWYVFRRGGVESDWGVCF